MENVVLLASVQEDAEGLFYKVAFLKGEPVEGHRAWEVAKLVSHVG
jgi:hypothetical protein